ncbi:MAG: hypothetical protein LJE68_15360 [Rhodobacter sp.]|nr:hypothetical protein [Rhodobacter sp.]
MAAARRKRLPSRRVQVRKATERPTRGLDKAFDCMKHITTLCTGIIGLTVTFAEKFKPANSDLSVPHSLKIAWVLFTVSLFFSLWSLLAITGSLNEIDAGKGSNNALSPNVRFPSLIAIVLFIAAIGFTVYAASDIARG